MNGQDRESGGQSSGQQGASGRADPLIGQQFGNYIASKLLGRGGMGSVYLARHPEIDREVAIKVLSEDLTEIPRAAARFLSEARAVTRIRHNNVIDIYDFGRLDDGRPFYVMELLGGHPLSDELVELGRLELDEAAPLVRQLCAGLQAAHDQGVIHRDLKPSNIHVLDEEPLAIKILDFGIAKILESNASGSETATGVVMGTPVVIAPEQAAGHPDRIGPHSDIYSLGVVLFWMLAGRPPFEDRVPGLLLSRHMSEPAPGIADVEPSIPPAVASVVDRCLEKEPHLRPDSAAEVGRLFALALDPSAASEVPAPRRRAAPVPAPVPAAGGQTLDLEHDTRAPALDDSLAGTTGEELEAAGVTAPQPWRWLGLAAALLLPLMIYLLWPAAEPVPGAAPASDPAPAAARALEPGAERVEATVADPAPDPAPKPAPSPEPVAAPAPVPPRKAARPRAKRSRARERKPSLVARPIESADEPKLAEPAPAVSPTPTPTPTPAAVPAAPAPAPAKKATPTTVGEGTIDPYAGG